MKKSPWTIVPILLTVLIFVVLFAKINRNEFWLHLRQIDMPLFILSQIVMLIPFLLMSIRWRMMINDYKKISLATSLELFFVSQSFNIITPSKMGDFAKPLLTRDSKFNLKIGCSAGMLEKLLDLFGVLFFAAAGILLVEVSKESVFILTTLLVLSIIVLFTIAYLDFTTGIFASIIRIAVPFRKPRQLLIDMLSYFDTLKKDRMKILFLLILTLGAWLGHLFSGYLILKSLGAEVPIYAAIGLIPIGILAGMLPITVGGLGARESAFVIVFSAFAPASVMLLFGLLFTIRYILTALVGLLWMNKYLKRSIRKT